MWSSSSATPSAREAAASRAAWCVATTASHHWPPWPGGRCPSSSTRSRSSAQIRATGAPVTWSGWGPRTSAPCGPTSPCTSNWAWRSSWSATTPRRALAGRRSRRFCRVRLRATRWLRRRASDCTGIRASRPGVGVPPPTALRGGRAWRCQDGQVRGVRLDDGSASGPPRWSWLPGPGRSTWPPASVSISRPGPAGADPVGRPGSRPRPVPVFSDLVSLQYVRTEAPRPSSWATATTPHPEWSDPDHYRERAADDELATAIPKFDHRFPGLDGARSRRRMQAATTSPPTTTR